MNLNLVFLIMFVILAGFTLIFLFILKGKDNTSKYDKWIEIIKETENKYLVLIIEGEEQIKSLDKQITTYQNKLNN